MRCVQFYWTRGYFSKNIVCNKAFRMALGYVENCRSRVPFITFGCLDGQILVQNFTKVNCVCIIACTR